ncbi:MAG: hypothetical protein ACC652_00205 [Acidimicrobiales bacterium]
MTDSDYSSWAVGWSAFAGTVLIVGGIFQAMTGLVAIVDDNIYLAGQEYVFELSTTSWGWSQLIWGLLVVFAGIGIFSGHVVGRTIGVIAAIVTALINFAWLPYYPIWGIIMIGISFAVIWALTVHGRDIAGG